MKKYLLKVSFLFSFLFGGGFAFGATQTYYISLSNLINCPNSCGGGSNYGTTGQGFTWNDVIPGGSTISSVSVQFNVGVECTPGSKQTLLNGISQSNINTPSWCSCTATNSIFTVAATPANYVIGGVNTFQVNAASTFGFCTNASLSGYYAIITVTYTSCTTPATPVSLSGTGTSLSTANLSWAAGTPAGSATVNYNWYVGTNPSGVCGTGTQTFNYSGSQTTWTVPAGVTSIEIDAYGAQGGNNSWSQIGGLGARAKGTFAVTPGQVLKILVGGQGGSGDCGGGGGGSFVTTSTNTPMCIAAGGGGAYYAYNSTGSGNMAGTTTNTGQSGWYYDGWTNAGPGGSSGNGGSASWNICNGGSGGGGLTGSGSSACDGCPNDGITTFGCSTSSGGSSFTSGGWGGWAAGWAGNGGFGGGGGGSSEGSYGGGGGGGYSGGGGGEGQGCGGGGGSYNSGTNTTNTAGVRSGNGIITISYRTYTGAVASGTTSGTSATATGLTCGTNYYLTVYASTSCDGSVSACATSAVFSTYSCCVTPGTPTSPSGSATGPTTANLSWTAGSPAGSTTLSYNWYVSTNPSGVCATTTVPFSYTGAIQNWTVPAGVTSITVEGYGAQGGNDACGTAGGLGARMRGTFAVTPGQTIRVLVGQQGINAALACSRGGGGGGGSFVYNLSNTTLLIAAGGGGGAGQSGYGNSTYANAVTTTSGLAGYAGGVGGVAGAGGGASTYCGGGAGWSTNGTNSSYGQGGLTFLNGGTGGAKYSDGGNGGFGGGGGSYAGAGGGGGYSGGGGGGWSMSGWGGGGGSYNGGTNQSNTAGVQSGNGSVTISYSTIGSSVASGNTTSTSVSATGLTCNTTYYLTVIATTSCDGSTSACATSTAFTSGSCCTAPSISVHPVSQTKCVGTSVTFSVTAAGTGITYQWRKGGTNIGGATSSTYSITSVAVGDGANYDVVITGTCGNITSNAATLTINTASALGTVSNAGPIDFCSATGDWSAAGPISVSGHNGTITWDWGSSNGTWNNGWTTGTSPLYATFPKKVSTSDANADRIRWSVTNGVCPATGYSSTILLRNHYNDAPATLTSNASITCLGNTATLTATFSSSINILGTVEFSTTCGGAPFATVTPGNNVTAVTATVVPVSGPNTYYARYNPGTGTGCTPSSCVSENIIANLAPTLPASNTSANTICTNTTANLSGNNPTIGTGIWSIISGPSTSLSQIADIYDNTTVFTPAGGAGNYVIRWTIDNLPCSSEIDDATIVVVGAPTPANAGTNQTMCATGTLVLAANNPSVGTGSWDILSGPSTNTSQLSSLIAYNATFDPISTAGGTYVLEWTTTSSAPCASTTSTMSITSNPAPTTSNAGSNQTICSNSTASLSANNPTIGVGTWSVTSGPSTLSTQFSNTALRTAVFTPAGGAGAYVLTWTISNAPCTASASSLTITVNAAPTTSNAGPAQSICISNTATMAANIPTVGTGAWSIIGGPSTNISQLSSTSAYNAVFTPSGGTGAYTFRWTITSTSPCATSTSNVIITVNSASVLGSVNNAGPIDFCDASGNWSAAGPVTVSGHNGIITWDLGSSNGSWTLGWDTGTQPLYTGIPKKVSASDGNPDRIRWSVQSPGCPATGYSASILLRNNYNEAPSSLTSNPASACATAATTATLTATFPTATNILGYVEFSTSCGGTPFATVPGNGTTTVNASFTTPGTSTTYFANYVPPTGTGCSASSCANTLVVADAVPVLGSVSNAGPIDFCSASGDWSAEAISVAGVTGIVWWQYGSSNGNWSGDWVTGISPSYTTFPKKIAASDANADRVRWYVKSTNGGCSPTSYSPAILLRNHYNENPTSLASTINNICTGVTGTLTATFPTATNITGTVEFATSCGGAPFATISGNGTTTVKTAFTAPSISTTYYARYNPGAGTGCSPGTCVNTTVNVNPPAPATPGIITGTVAQCPSVSGLSYSIVAVTNATSYTWTVPTGWSVTSGAGTNAITVTSGIFGQNGNITVTATNSCGTSAAAVLAVNTNGCLPAPSMMVFPTNANVFVTIANRAVLTLGNPSPTAIANPGVNGAYKSWVISEGQGNAVQWNDITANTYVIPFGYSNTDYIPFTFSKTSAGSSNLNISTWGTPSNNTPWATATNVAAVTNMWSSAIGSDASIPSVIDRWWDINTTATANLVFSYRGAENTTTLAPNAIFAAQHWNGTTWDAPVGSGNGVTTGIGTVTVTGASTFSPWILSSTDAPLPVSWLDVSADCNRGDVIIKWSTASEQNADYFSVERSLNGSDFTNIATVKASGNSNVVKKYSATDPDPYNGASFYRIKETDFNSNFSYSKILAVNACSNNDISIFGNGYGVSISIHSEVDDEFTFEIYDVLGQKLLHESKTVTNGDNHFKLTPQNISSAIYIVKVYNKNNSETKKIFIRKQE